MQPVTLTGPTVPHGTLAQPQTERHTGTELYCTTFRPIVGAFPNCDAFEITACVKKEATGTAYCVKRSIFQHYETERAMQEYNRLVSHMAQHWQTEYNRVNKGA